MGVTQTGGVAAQQAGQLWTTLRQHESAYARSYQRAYRHLLQLRAGQQLRTGEAGAASAAKGDRVDTLLRELTMLKRLAQPSRYVTYETPIYDDLAMATAMTPLRAYGPLLPRGLPSNAVVSAHLAVPGACRNSTPSRQTSSS